MNANDGRPISARNKANYIAAKAAYNEAQLTVAYLPSFQQMTDVPDFFPFAIADRGAYWTDHTRTAEHCL